MSSRYIKMVVNWFSAKICFCFTISRIVVYAVLLVISSSDQLENELKYIPVIICFTAFSSPAWISNHKPSKVWDEITYPFPNFNGCTGEVW